ncbi:MULTISPECIES: LysR family transcriptional regulator [Rhizobium/Agrobacterium group]|uniref:LysR family transcriptional regulator n=1 Tax=Rhizobium/Agrobacterium group TaxID=227290 RepID=UPI0023006368|nr:MULTISPECIES: LysR family transcriptional regulator [Rhizobium/Agrobacterium group]MDA5635933.1 LysR family transcriptional regulator [Agrobacterium sp. ST15.16.024]MDF1891158.1 LysR family transcriptional regulator [Rhizobium rhizogenes]
MLIRHLKFFVTLAEEQHFGRAAQICSVTQPTLSQAIRKLEEDLNLALIVRSHRFVSLTPEGEKVLRWGRQILADYDSLHDDLSGKTKGGLTGTLQLGVIPAAMPSVSFLAHQFEDRNPLVQIEIRSMSSRIIEKSLENFEIDGGITYLDNEPIEHVRRFPLYHERYVFACREDHPLAGREKVTWAQAVREPLCLLSVDMQNRRILNRIAAGAGLELRPKVVSNSFLGVASHLRLGHWCAIVPHTFGFVFGGAEDLVLLDMVEPVHQQTIGLVLADRLPQSPMALALQDCADTVDIEAEFASMLARSPWSRGKRL